MEINAQPAPRSRVNREPREEDPGLEMISRRPPKQKISKYVNLTKKGKNYFGVCPFHDDHSPSMSVSPEKQIYTCFSCGASGNVFTFVADFE